MIGRIAVSLKKMCNLYVTATKDEIRAYNTCGSEPASPVLIQAHLTFCVVSRMKNYGLLGAD
jgi:hypothetical protein